MYSASGMSSIALARARRGRGRLSAAGQHIGDRGRMLQSGRRVHGAFGGGVFVPNDSREEEFTGAELARRVLSHVLADAA